MYLKSLFYKSTLRILKKIMGRVLGGPQNPQKWKNWVKIQTLCIISWVKNTFWKLHTPGFSVLYMIQYGTFQYFCIWVWPNRFYSGFSTELSFDLFVKRKDVLESQMARQSFTWKIMTMGRGYLPELLRSEVVQMSSSQANWCRQTEQGVSRLRL